MDYFQCQRGGRNWRFWFKWPHLCVGVCVQPETTAARAPRRRRRRIGNRFLPPGPNKNLMLTNGTFCLGKNGRVLNFFFFLFLIGPAAINVPIDSRILISFKGIFQVENALLRIVAIFSQIRQLFIHSQRSLS